MYCVDSCSFYGVRVFLALLSVCSYSFVVVLCSVFVVLFCFFFFFSSRRRHTRSLCDWSSDVCSSDLYSCDLLQRLGLLNSQGCDAFYRRVIFPCCQGGRVVNLYGRSIAAAFAHRFLPGSKGGLFAWESVCQFSTVILVEGLFDLAVLWQVGFRHVTCSLGTHLNADQFQQLCDRPRTVYLTFDVRSEEHTSELQSH